MLQVHLVFKNASIYVRVENFVFVPGFEYANTIPEDAAKRIAFAMYKSKKDRASPRNEWNGGGSGADGYSWFYKPFYGTWARNYREPIIAKYIEIAPLLVLNEIVEKYKLSAKNLKVL